MSRISLISVSLWLITISCITINDCSSWKINSIALNNRLNKLIGGAAITLISSFSMIEPSNGFDQWNDRNRLAAEVWRTIDDLYYDRSFNGIDWFQARQSLVKKNYNSDEELYAAIKNMISLLGDKYTRYLPPAQYNVLINSAVGELTGVGVQLIGKDDGSIIISDIEDLSPAKNSGLKRGDVLVNIDGTDTTGLSPEEVAAQIRGAKGTKARLRVRRLDGLIEDVVVTREPFKLTGLTTNRITVKGKPVGVIRVKSFSSSTSTDMFSAMESLKMADIDIFAIDLRNNGGGVLQAAVDAANAFLPPGKIVTFVVNKDGLSEALQTLPGSITIDASDLPDLTSKLIIIVNRDTASAAEVFTAGLKENDRAIVIGEKTFGKGIIQNLQQLRQGGVAVTIAKYETPKHNNINKIGIEVDLPVDCNESIDLAECLSPALK